MKNRKPLYISLTVILIGLFVWWCLRPQGSSPRRPTLRTVAGTVHASITSSQTSPFAVEGAAKQLAVMGDRSTVRARLAVFTHAGIFNDPVSYAELVAAGVTKEDIVKGALDAENQQPINVYGKVVDQSGASIASVQVQGGVLLNVGFESSGNKDYLTQTDANGVFSFLDLRGVRIGIKLMKAGYEFNQNLYTTWYNTYKPDPKAPAIFTMYRLKGAEPMVHTKFDSRVPYDGTSATFNLYTGKKSDAGDLKITLLRTPQKVIRGQDHFEWNVKIEVAGGGIAESLDPYPYLAPDRSYQNEFSFGQSKDAPSWSLGLQKTFYVRTQKGIYGRISIDLAADSERPDTGITIDAYLNPSGSRNLEFDSAKEVKAK